MRVALIILGLFFLSVTSDVIHYHYHGMRPEDIPNHDGLWDWFKSKTKNVSCKSKCRYDHCGYNLYCESDEEPAYKRCLAEKCGIVDHDEGHGH